MFKSPCPYIRDNELPVVEFTLDLGVTVMNDLSPCDHIKTLSPYLIRVQMLYTIVLYQGTNGL